MSARVHAGGVGQDLGGPLGGQGPVELGRDGQRVAGEHRHPDAGGEHRQVRAGPGSCGSRCAACAPRRSRRSRRPAGRRPCGITLKATVAGKTTDSPEVDGPAVGDEGERPVGALADLLLELGGAGQAGATGRLVGADRQADEARLAVERRQGRHGHHGRAVGVGHDALGQVGQQVGVDLGDHQGDLGVHAPGRGVVDHDRALAPRPSGRGPGTGGGPGGEEGEVEARLVGGGGVLDGDRRALPVDGAPGRAGRGEEAELVDRERPARRGSPA